VDDPEVRDWFLETVEGETDRLIRLVNDLLILSRADSEALNLQHEPVDVGQLVRVMAERLRPRAEARDVALEVAIAPGLPPVSVDADRIEQVLVNLTDNAIKYSRPGGTVNIDVVDGPDRTVQVRVRDEGIGIPAEALLRIGERFYRADKGRARTEGGSGLGLAIARALVEAHDGRLWLESKEGEGTTVTFALPSG
jgi:signal transduction histidine kinase